MNIEIHTINDQRVAEVLSDVEVVSDIEAGLNLLGDLYYQHFDKVVIHEKNITPQFFNLKTGLAGELLQKFSNYRVRLVIVGDFSKYVSKSLKDFIYESNKGKQVNFVQSLPEAIQVLSRN